MINVFVVEDSMVVRDLIVYILKSDPAINILGVAKNGKEALDFIEKKKPDVVTMDIKMPVMDGIEATRRIMETTPVPIIILSAFWDSKDITDTFNALQIGAVAIAEKPIGFDNPRFKEVAGNIIQLVKLMSEIKVIKRTSSRLKQINEKTPNVKYISEQNSSLIKLVGIGASTGGPVVIEKILADLNREFAFPIIIVQHILFGFVEGFAEWLNQSSNVKVKIAAHKEKLEKGFCYLAPDGHHIKVNAGLEIDLIKQSSTDKICPSVSFLFESMAKYFGKESIAIILSGMGKDGCFELKELNEKGSVTIAQNEESSIVFGMPGEAIKLNAVKHIFSPKAISDFLNEISEISN